MFQRKLLCLACKTGKSQIVHYLFDHVAYSNVTNSDDNFIQHLCFKSGDSKCLPTLKELGPLDICKQDENKDTIVHLACRQESDDVLEYILQSTNDCGRAFSLQNKNGDSPLHILAMKRIILSSKPLALIKCDDLNVQHLHGNTPLHLACQPKHNNFAKHLIDSCQSNLNIPNNQDELPLHKAVVQSELHLVKLLASSSNVQKQTKNGDTSLHIACQQDFVCLDIVEFLLNLNRDLKIPNNVGDTPVHIAVASSNPFSLVEKLVENITVSDIPSNKANENGDTILHIACWKADSQTISFLINSLGCRTDVINEKTGATPLHFACAKGSLSVIKLVSRCDQFSKIIETKLFPKEFQFSPGEHLFM